MVSTLPGTPARADVTVYRQTGVHRVFVAESQTATERGNALIDAMSYAQDGSVVVLASGTFYVGEYSVDLSLGGIGTVHLHGAGKYATLIQSDASLGSGAGTSAVHPGVTNCVVRDLGIECLNTANTSPYPSQSCWGCSSGESAFTNAQLHDCYLIGQSDGIYIKNNSACTARIRDVEATSTFDSFALLSGSGSHEVEVWNSTFISSAVSSQPAYSADGTVRGASISGTGTVRFYSCDFQAIGGTPIDAACTALNVAGTNAVVKAYNCRFYANNSGTANAIGVRVLTQATAAVTCYGGECDTTASGGGSAYDVSQATGTLRVVGLSFDDAKVSGSPTFGLWNGVIPTTSGLNTLST